jgi:hypothetical protein
MRAPPDLSVRAEAYPLSSYVELAIAQLALGDSVSAWVTQERGLSRSWAERAWARGVIDSTHAWDGLLGRVQSQLTDSSAVIGWLDPYYLPGSWFNPSWTYVIRRTGSIHWTETRGAVDANPNKDVLELTRERMQVAADWPFRIDRFDEIAADQREVWKSRFRGAEPFLHGVRELIVVSPYVDYEAPLEIAIDSTGRPLVERFAISYSPSALHFALSPPPQRDGRSRRAWSALIVRGPGRRSADGHDDLTEGDAEVRELVGHVLHSIELRGTAASARRLCSLSDAGKLAGMDLIHITSHAAAPYGWSSDVGLTLAEPAPGSRALATTAKDRHGLLTAEEVRNWSLSSRLVTLASCSSAGLESFHIEGMPGLGTGFLAAGARSVLVSLWPVDDEATAILMRYFYDALFEERARPCSISEALREAQERLRDYRDPSGRRPYEHPARWGSYVLLGDPG